LQQTIIYPQATPQLPNADVSFVVKKKEDNPYTTYRIFLGVFGTLIFILSAVLGYLFLQQFPQDQVVPEQRTFTIQKATAQVLPIPTQAFEVSDKTKIATSLIVPELYKHWIWQATQPSANTESLMEVVADRMDKDYLPIPFANGKLYTSTTPVLSNPDDNLLSNYYAIQLQQSGWVLAGSVDPYLTFQSFRLQANTSDNICEGFSNFLGYNNGMVRLVSVQHEIEPCTLSTQLPESTSGRNIIYTVFVSDPVSVQSISDYFTAHMQQ